MLDIIFLGLILIGFLSMKCFMKWCEKQITK